MWNMKANGADLEMEELMGHLGSCSAFLNELFTVTDVQILLRSLCWRCQGPTGFYLCLFEMECRLCNFFHDVEDPVGTLHENDVCANRLFQ